MLEGSRYVNSEKLRSLSLVSRDLEKGREYLFWVLLVWALSNWARSRIWVVDSKMVGIVF